MLTKYWRMVLFGLLLCAGIVVFFFRSEIGRFYKDNFANTKVVLVEPSNLLGENKVSGVIEGVFIKPSLVGDDDYALKIILRVFVRSEEEERAIYFYDKKELSETSILDSENNPIAAELLKVGDVVTLDNVNKVIKILKSDQK